MLGRAMCQVRQRVTGQNGTYWTKWYGQNVTDKMVAISVDFNSIEFNIYLASSNHKLQIK